MPLLVATIPDFSPVTVAAATVRLPALLWLAVADIPVSAVPVTTPVAVTDRLPLPLLVAMIPNVWPATVAAETVMSPASASVALPKIPASPRPVTMPVASMERSPVPPLVAPIPDVSPVTVAAETATPLPWLPPFARIPSLAPPVTLPTAVTDTLPAPLLSAWIPILPPLTPAAEIVIPPAPLLVAKIPCSSLPVTVSLAATDRAPLPALTALIPCVLPVTAAAEIDRLFPCAEDLTSALIPSPPRPMTAPVAATSTDPCPRTTTKIPVDDPVTRAARTDASVSCELPLTSISIPCAFVPLPTTVPEATTSTLPPLKLMTWIPAPADPATEPFDVTETRLSPLVCT